jgi:hypothetical protein
VQAKLPINGEPQWTANSTAQYAPHTATVCAAYHSTHFTAKYSAVPGADNSTKCPTIDCAEQCSLRTAFEPAFSSANPSTSCSSEWSANLCPICDANDPTEPIAKRTAVH